MPDVPLQIKKLRLDLHYGNDTSNSTFVSHFAQTSQGTHRVFDLPQLGVQVAGIWPAVKEYGSHPPIAEIDVRPFTVTLRNIDAEIRVATPDGVSFIRLAKRQTLQIRLGDVISINETLIAVHSARQPLQPVELPTVDPRNMNLYSADMDDDTVRRSVMNSTVERFHASPEPVPAEDVQQPRLASPAPSPPKASLIGDGLPSSPDHEPNEDAIPAASALYTAVAEVESQEPGALKFDHAVPDCDTQEADSLVDFGIGFLNETTAQVCEKLTAVNLNDQDNKPSGSKPAKARYMPESNKDTEGMYDDNDDDDDDAETASSASLEIIEPVSASTDAISVAAQDHAEEPAKSARAYEKQRSSPTPSYHASKSKGETSEAVNTLPKASSVSTDDDESENESGGFELASTGDHSGDTDLDEPLENTSITRKSNFKQPDRDSNLAEKFSDMTEHYQQTNGKDATTNNDVDGDEDMIIDEGTRGGTNILNIVGETTKNTPTPKKGHDKHTTKTVVVRQKDARHVAKNTGNDTEKELSGNAYSNEKSRHMGNKQADSSDGLDEAQNKTGNGADTKREEQGGDFNKKQDQENGRDSDNAQPRIPGKRKTEAKPSTKSSKRKRTGSDTSMSSTIELAYSIEKEDAMSTTPSNVAPATKTRKTTTKSVKFADSVDDASPASNARSARSTTSGSAKKSPDTSKITKVFFSSATDIENRIGKRLLKKLGIVTVEDVESCDVFLVGTGQGFKRTYRSLHAIALGKALITDSWLSDARSSGFLDECDDHWIVDPERELEWGTTIFTAAKRFKSGCKPFKDKVVRLSTQLQKEIFKENLASLKALLFACGAKDVLLGNPIETSSVDVIFIGTSSKKDLADAVKFDFQLYSKNLIPMSVLNGKVDLSDPQFQLGGKVNVANNDDNDDDDDDEPRKKRRKTT